MFEGLFDIKNDRRLSVYLYRSGVACWLLYLVAGSPLLGALAAYRNEIGVFSALLMITGFTASMVFEYIHHRALYEQKKKWLFASYVFLGFLLYFLEFKGTSLPQFWMQFLAWLG